MAVLTLNNGLKITNVIPQIHYAVTVSADNDGHAAAVSADGKLYLLGNGEILVSKEISGSDEIYTCCMFDPNGRMYAGTSGNRIIIYDISGDSIVRNGEINTQNLKATPHKERLSPLHASCLRLFRHLAQKFFDLRQQACIISVQSAEKFACAICAQSLCGIALTTYSP